MPYIELCSVAAHSAIQSDCRKANTSPDAIYEPIRSPVDPELLKPLIASRLVAIDKCPGVRPIGIGEVSRRIISKAILTIINADIQEAVGTHQLCVGQKYSCEAAIHALESIFDREATEGVLLIDASNAFNNLNRRATLANVQLICPAFANVLINCYRADPALYIDGETIPSSEGTMQGDPLTMATYAIGILPLILHLKSESEQIWYADDSSAGGTLSNLRRWWDRILKLGPDFGYFINASKLVMIVKEESLEEAERLFEGSDIQITTAGGKYLGGSIGNGTFKEAFVKKKVEQWKTELESLAQIAASQPQSAYSLLTHSLQHKWSFLMRSMRDVSQLLQPIEDVIRHKVIPAITGKQNISDAERRLFSLPTRMGGLGIGIPTELAQQEFCNSVTVTKPLVQSMLGESDMNNVEIKSDQDQARKSVHLKNKQTNDRTAEETVRVLPETTQRAVSLAQEQGAASWLNTLPIEEHGFALHKGAFQDALALRFGWRPVGMATMYVCGKSNDVQHALSCKTGGLPIHRHNDIRDLTTSLMSEVSTSTETEPQLQPLSGESLSRRSAIAQDDSRLDIRCRGFWQSGQDAFFDVRVFNPLAASDWNATLSSVYRRHEQEKRREYDQRVQEVEHGTFAPLVFAASGGMGPSTTIAYKRLASLLASKRGHPYATTMRWLRCRISFSLLRSAITAIRGTRPSANTLTQSIPLAMAEGRIA